jgi:hypothetical protein
LPRSARRYLAQPVQGLRWLPIQKRRVAHTLAQRRTARFRLFPTAKHQPRNPPLQGTRTNDTGNSSPKVSVALPCMGLRYRFARRYGGDRLLTVVGRYRGSQRILSEEQRQIYHRDQGRLTRVSPLIDTHDQQTTSRLPSHWSPYDREQTSVASIND